ncbi:MAG: isoleucine--tRNA ligase, partial [Candidatus Eremiobacteraeota bacterium]|nr:isoleucine--tRNA ligase [Candidatus Eremiobacteraeota bacterium]
MSDTPGLRDYRETLNLPNTAFPMKADLSRREPALVSWWQEQGTYERRLERNRRNPAWILHDGPPYANGELHMGHFLNMVIKDIFVKIALLNERWAKFVPGWDMHGLPIEIETLRHLKLDFHAIDPLQLRAHCRERSIHWLQVQKNTRMRMGVFGDFDHPYRTIDPEFEATIVETLADLAQAQQLYKGLRSTLWCIFDETALAEAEIEYKDKVSVSVFVRFTATQEQRAEILRTFQLSDTAVPQRVSFLIWTTTPWTLPANVAIALRPDALYGLYRAGDEALIVAEQLSVAVLGEKADQMSVTLGEALGGAKVRHPFMDRDSLVVTAEYVDLEMGTGAVHTAPGHGTDDFETGLRYALPTIMPVDAQGDFTEQAGIYAGRNVFLANDAIVNDLRATGALFAVRELTHSYPHCWRCHNPVIFRATSQWFLAMDVNLLRRRVIDAIPDVAWKPEWGAQRMTSMMENHPEWCISRQRLWGTPIPALTCRDCDESILDPDLARIAAARFRVEGSDVWYTADVESFLPPGFTCPKCHGTQFDKEKNIVDIWFESGVTHLAVLGKSGLPWPADAVVEGGDQYRGWFRSSLVTAIAIKGAPPYKQVVKNGWVVDAQGRAMHKSTGNYVGAQEAMARYGADVLRLWIASVDFTEDVRFGATLLENVSRVYRNLRYRLRYMLSLINDFLPQHLVSRDEMEPIDKLACDAVDDLATRVNGYYEQFRLHDAYLALIAFDGEDLSSFYLDGLKDRLYSGARNSQRRRSGQTAVAYILERFVT